MKPRMVVITDLGDSVDVEGHNLESEEDLFELLEDALEALANELGYDEIPGKLN